MLLTRRLVAATAVASVALASACSSDKSTGPSAPQPIIGVTATALTTSTVKVTFTSRTTDNSYNIERAEGSAGTFSQVGTVPAPSTAQLVTFNDASLTLNTLYRYRVIAVASGLSSAPSSEASVTTLNVGNASADLTTDITASRTLYKDTVYTLKGFIHVTNGATLTIEPGTTIKGDFNTLGASLFILRGAKINAVGTAALPIVFTSSRAAGSRQPGDWGGLILVGNAPSARSGNVIVEGTGTDGTAIVGGKNYEVTYSGGTTATDNSGTLSYVRVEFAGFAPALNTELNSFTFGAVGSGTRASYLQSMGGLDDAYEFFGGGFDLDHLVAYETGDDMYDMSEGFQGRMQYLIGFNSVQLTPRTGAGSLATDLEGFEIDGCIGSGCDNGFNQEPFTIPLVANWTIVGCGSQSCVGPGGGYGMMLRRGTGGYWINGVAARFPAGGVSLRDAETFQRAGSVAVPDLATSDFQVRNDYFTELGGPLFQANTATPATQFEFDAAGNSLTLATVAATTLFAAIPAAGAVPSGVSAFDWTPAASSPITTGGMSTFSGKIATKAGTFVTGTSYVGAADPAGAKWWAGWTVYARN
ncbi:MAG TPA: fibronectin type III domain-containing protein [Gemmatimonadaceae bacterium]|jgi:hypothetical protein